MRWVWSSAGWCTVCVCVIVCVCGCARVYNTVRLSRVSITVDQILSGEMGVVISRSGHFAFEHAEVVRNFKRTHTRSGHFAFDHAEVVSNLKRAHKGSSKRLCSMHVKSPYMKKYIRRKHTKKYICRKDMNVRDKYVFNSGAALGDPRSILPYYYIAHTCNPS